MPTVNKQDKANAIKRLQEWLKDGDTLYFILRHRSASGLQRSYSVKQIEVIDGKILTSKILTSDLTYTIHKACGYAYSGKHEAIKVNGCGFSGEQDIADSVALACGFSKLKYQTL